jgi:ribose transport system ATP-binding protein
VVAEFSSDRVNESELVGLMIGRSLNQTFPTKRSEKVDGQEPVVSVEKLQIDGRLSSIDLSVYPGEIVGVAALVGQGQKELFYSLAGILKTDGGSITVHSGPAGSKNVKQDFALVPEDRKTEGLFLPMTTRSNLTISVLKGFSLLGTIRKRKEEAFATQAAADINLPETFLSRPIRELSGGNQQKVLFGRTILMHPSCLLLFDPTRGVDIGTKVEIYHMIRRFANAGGAVLMYSTEIPEIIGLCDRIYTLYGGKLSGEFVEDSFNEHSVMAGALGFGQEQIS